MDSVIHLLNNWALTSKNDFKKITIFVTISELQLFITVCRVYFSLKSFNENLKGR